MQFKAAAMVVSVVVAIFFVGCDSTKADSPCSDGGTICPGGQFCADKTCYAVCTNSVSCEDNEACIDSLCRDYSATCTSDDSCAAGWFCNSNLVCERLIRVGVPCTDNGSCELGQCSDGVCCTEACDGLCSSCVGGQTGGSDGICLALVAGADPDDECDGILACNGNGQCFAKANDESCENDFECLSARCIEGLCREGLCGDGHVDPNEVCDDGNTAGGDYCSANCSNITGSCGDSEVQTNEACDDGNTADGDYCATDCTAVIGACGDSTVQTNEDCDDGDTEDSGNGCSTSCAQNNNCGDNQLQSLFENCDDGDAIDTGNGCSEECLYNNVCGDGDPEEVVEDCDDGDTEDTGNGCASDCTQNNVCGNGDIESYFEECDDNEVGDQGNGCSETCQNNSECGNDQVESYYEACDDGNSVDNGNGCSSSCQKNNTCGNGVLEDVFESCDDAAASGGDGCSELCEVEAGSACYGVPSVCVRVFYVNRNSTHSSPTGGTWSDALVSVQDAIDQANNGDEIWVAWGKYYPSTGSGREKSFVLKDGVALYGGFDGTEVQRSERDWIANETILNGNIQYLTDLVDGTQNNNAYHVVTGINLLGTSTSLDGFIIEAGESSLDVDTQSDRKNGAGIWLKDSNLIIANTVFRVNQAKSTQGYGGAMYIEHSNPTIVNSTFYGNISNAFGGVIYANHQSVVTISLSTFVDNFAWSGGSAIYLNGGATATVSNSIFWQCLDGISPADCSPNFFSGSGRTITDSCIEGAGIDNAARITTADPMFFDAAGRDFRISAIALKNYGDSSKIPVDSTDMDGDGNRTEFVPVDGYGKPREVGNAVDLGASEIQ